MTRGRAAIVAVAFMLGAAADDNGDAFDRAVAALTMGSRAVELGDRPKLRIAAIALRGSGAQPIVGDDLATRWLRQAHVRPTAVERNRVLGPGYRTLEIEGGREARFEQTFLAGQLARVAVVALRGADFSMRVSSDENPKLCAVGPASGRCEWVPTYTTRFTIAIANPGRATGRYLVVMQ